MSSESVRKQSAHALLRHDNLKPASEQDATVSGDSVVCDVETSSTVGRLWREAGRLMYANASGSAAEAVRVAWARPLSGRGGAVAILQAGKKKEVAFLASPEVLAEESRELLLEELAAATVLPRITEIIKITPRFGNYTWDVETDMGRRRFMFSSPEKNSFYPKADAIVVRDVAENCYEIFPVSDLSRGSRYMLDLVL